MSIRFSHSSFPCTPEQKSDCGLPWGCLLQPLAPLPSPSQTRVLSNQVERCTTCFAYINPYVTYVRQGWKCAICRATNSFQTKRYDKVDERVRLPEITMSDIEYIWVEETEPNKKPAASPNGQTDEDSQESAAAIESYKLASDYSSTNYDPAATLNAPFAPSASASLSPPAYLFLVDLSGDYNVTEVVKSSLLAAIEALSPQVWVGLAVVSSKLGLYDLRCSTPSVNYVALRSAEVAQRFGGPLDEQPTSLSLETLIPLDNFLQKLEFCKEHLCTAIESLTTHQKKLELEELEREIEQGEQDFESGASAASPTPSSSIAPKKPKNTPRVSPFGFGGALSALLSYLSSIEEQGFELNIRILSFLSQRPNWGLGALEDRVNGLDEVGNKRELNEDDWNRFLFQPSSEPMAFSGVNATANNKRGFVSSKNSADFYKELGAVASQKGICIDTYIIASSPTQYFDLATLKYLSVLTGGNMILYPSLSECTLPQDLFRQLRLLQGFRCMLRIRTSPEFQASNVYGHLVADEAVENLFHLGGCDARKVYAVDWEFCGTEGFKGGYVDVVPVIQVAFSYIGVRNVDGVETIEHKLRILTRQLPLVHFYQAAGSGGTKESRQALRLKSHHQSLTELYQSSHPEIILTLLIHQVIHACLERGVLESRELIKEWLVNFLKAYHKVFGVKKIVPVSSPSEAKDDGNPTSPTSNQITPDSLDLTLSSAEALQFLSRFIFALLKSPLIASEPHVVTPDLRVYLQVLYSGLEAEYLVKSIYPTLTSFKTELEGDATQAPQAASQVKVSLHHPVLYLTRYSLSGCGDQIFVLDNYRQLFVLHTGFAAQHPHLLPLPPPATSEIAKYLKRVKLTTPYLTPKVLCCADDTAQTSGLTMAYGLATTTTSTGINKDANLRTFLHHLLEDETGGSYGFSYQTFLQEVGKEVAERMNSEANEE